MQDTGDLFGSWTDKADAMILAFDPAEEPKARDVLVLSGATGSVIDFSVEMPHEDASLLNVRRYHDGTWFVTMCDRLGVGYDHIHTGHGPDPLSASRSVRDAVLASIGERQVRSQKTADAAAARSASTLAARGVVAARPVRPLGAQRTGASGSAVTGGSVAYAGSVPRNAAKWVVDPGAVTVALQPGLVWSDVGGSDERVFPTIRMAKDVTRAATRG